MQFECTGTHLLYISGSFPGDDGRQAEILDCVSLTPLAAKLKYSRDSDKRSEEQKAISSELSTFRATQVVLILLSRDRESLTQIYNTSVVHFNISESVLLIGSLPHEYKFELG